MVLALGCFEDLLALPAETDGEVLNRLAIVDLDLQYIADSDFLNRQFRLHKIQRARHAAQIQFRRQHLQPFRLQATFPSSIRVVIVAFGPQRGQALRRWAGTLRKSFVRAL
jgi:hypothetical protein